jgi:hypothetical protein
MNVYIMAVTTNPIETWLTCGADRDEAEHWYAEALARGAPAPLYRVVCKRKRS